MHIIPAIDLRDGRCVRLRQGIRSQQTVYDADPIDIATRFATAGASMVHVVDLDGAFNGAASANRSVLKGILNAVKVPVQFGGGIRSVDDVERLHALGVARVILGTLATESTDILMHLLDRFGSFVAVGIDARDGRVMTRGWEQASETKAVDLAQTVAAIGVERIIYTDIARDGMLTGPNIQQTVALARAAGVRVTASGGVSSLDDIRRLAESGEPLVDSVIVGKAFYEGRFTMEEAQLACN
jgi:phosphoribosylformimino-5-aminoimidazole carboxamide ribotide isomerase